MVNPEMPQGRMFRTKVTCHHQLGVKVGSSFKMGLFRAFSPESLKQTHVPQLHEILSLGSILTQGPSKTYLSLKNPVTLGPLNKEH